MSELTSKATARIIDLISEGELKTNPTDKDIFFDDVVLQNADNSYNFEGIRTYFRSGQVGQSVIPGFRDVENTVAVGSQITTVSPRTFTVTDNTIDAVIVTVGVNAFSDTDLDDGDMHDTSVTLAIDTQPNGGAYAQVATIIIDGKTNSSYDRSKRLALGNSGFPWNVRVRRITADSSSVDVQNDTFLRSYTLINDVRLRYSYSALVGLEVDAEAFGSQFPVRKFRVPAGIICKIPSNYNPVTRVYTGIWDGTFIQDATNNPAWILADVATRLRYGLGDIFNFTNIDKFALYTIGQYCDALVPNGAGGTEPRFQCNVVINTREDAARVLDTLASIFRGMIYYGAGAVAFTQDSPLVIKKLVAPANVLDGDFNYPNSGGKARHSAVSVSWNNPDLLGELDRELVVRDRLVEKYGYNEAEPIAAVGCTTRGQAIRVGEWLLDTEEHETELCVYKCALDQMDVRPGDGVSISDPHYMGVRYGGRIMAVAGNLKSITIDDPVNITVGETFVLSITMRDGSIVTRTLTNASGANQTVLTFTTALASTPIDNAIWSLASTNVNPRPFRVLTIKEQGDQYEVTALFHDVTKYARIERNRNVNPPPYSLPGRLLTPGVLTITEYTFDNGDDLVPAALIAWGPSNDPRSNGYEYQIWDGNDKTWQRKRQQRGHSIDYRSAPKGLLKIRVRTIGNKDKPSAWVTQNATITGFPFPTSATTLTVTGESNRIVLRTDDNSNPKFKDWLVYRSSTNNFNAASIVGHFQGQKWTDDNLPAGAIRYYWIVARNKKGDVSDRYPAGPATNNGVSGLVGYILESDTDPTTPTAPLNLTLSQDTQVSQNGHVNINLNMVCDVSGSATDRWRYVYYIDDGVNAEYTVVVNPNVALTKARHQITDCVIGRTYSIRVLAVTGTNKIGSITTAVTKTITNKPGAPADPTGLTVTNGGGALYGKISLEWNPCADRDFAYTEVRKNNTNSYSGSVVVARIRDTNWTDHNLPNGVTRYYWIQHYDTSGNPSTNRLPTGTGQQGDTRRIKTDDVGTGEIKRDNVSTNDSDNINTTNIHKGSISAAVSRAPEKGKGSVTGSKKKTIALWKGKYLTCKNLAGAMEFISYGVSISCTANVLVGYHTGATIATVVLQYSRDGTHWTPFLNKSIKSEKTSDDHVSPIVGSIKAFDGFTIPGSPKKGTTLYVKGSVIFQGLGVLTGNPKYTYNVGVSIFTNRR